MAGWHKVADNVEQYGTYAMWRTIDPMPRPVVSPLTMREQVYSSGAIDAVKSPDGTWEVDPAREVYPTLLQQKATALQAYFKGKPK